MKRLLLQCAVAEVVSIRRLCPRDDAAAALTLHYPSMVGGKPQAILCNVDVHLVCEIDGLEELVQRPRGAGNRAEDGRPGGRALCVHDAGDLRAREGNVFSLNGAPVWKCTNRLGFKRCYGTASARGLGILDVDSDRTKHVNHAKPATPLDELEGVGAGAWGGRN